jgi:hypothetical protein
MTTTFGPERFAIVEIPPGTPPANSLLIGPLDMLMEQIPDTKARSDAIARLDAARLDAEQISKVQNVTRALQVATFCDSINHITRRLDAYQSRRDARLKADQEQREREEQQLIEDQLSKLPDPDAPGPFAPAGDLHDVPPSEPENREELTAIQPEDSEGDLPNELLEDIPLTTGTDPDLSGSQQPTNRNPVGISW